jgi:hypothetical protein
MTEENQRSPDRSARAARLLLMLSPFLFAFCYFLALAQSASELPSVVIGLAGFGMCLGAAALNALRSSISGGST